MDTHIVRHPDLHAFSARAAPWLLRIEAEHNLMLALVAQLQHSDATEGDPPYLVSVEQGGTVVGCAVRAPPGKLLITRMPFAAIPALVADAGSCFSTLPAVLGPESTAREFGRCWAVRHDVLPAAGMRQRLYALRTVRQPARSAPGSIRNATRQDLELVASWIEAYSSESGIRIPAMRHAARRIDADDIFLWCNDGPRSMAGVAGRTRSGSRIGYVYTPPAERGRGYATACVASLTQRELALGAAFCCLFTDLANWTSNSIYQQVGYEPVCDFLDVMFAPRS